METPIQIDDSVEPVVGMNEGYGIYAIELINGGIVYSKNCDIMVLKLDHYNPGIWYYPNNKENVIQIVEKWVFIPYHAIVRIQYNKDPKS